MRYADQPLVREDRTENRPGEESLERPAHGSGRTVSRRTLLRRSGAVAAGTIVAGALGAGGRAATALASATSLGVRAPTGTDPLPRDAIAGLLEAMQRFPLVGLGERHGIQETYDFLTGLLVNPALPARITDIVVECGNAKHQDLADRFVLGDEPIANSDLAQIWRFTVGGGVIWDAPVYEQFFRTVRAVNWMRPPSRRIRVLLGDPAFDYRRVRGVADKGYVIATQRQRDAHYAAIVEREVLAKGRRALMIAGANHLLQGLISNDNPQGLNAASLLVQRHPGVLFVVDLLVLPPGRPDNPLVQRAEAMVAHWPRPAMANLAGTWLGATTESAEPWVNSAAYLAATASARRFGAQADAILYLGPGAALTASRPDPSIYQFGAYRGELQRVSRIATQIEGQPVDFVADGLREALGGPSWFATNGPAPSK